ncbi:hypothetical protein G6F70_000746 [Rhizopus microsporus]|nr:hypothetical protein G6F71_007430 [Rhizopus microsporus]KAG1204175.1 hypothetical protein G6F70_000746 [Rhizopus microsporus]KAG1211092.1 hypothetical protein G6F69_004907 [Rhizopus microsporus]KAG1232952.1 hypothetical protein G6F67_004645 [Rhizopus microsporus]KAG1265010.1 hypothetical protein G6F68_003917 [Rhizopus microsporus]
MRLFFINNPLLNDNKSRISLKSLHKLIKKKNTLSKTDTTTTTATTTTATTTTTTTTTTTAAAAAVATTTTATTTATSTVSLAKPVKLPVNGYKQQQWIEHRTTDDDACPIIYSTHSYIRSKRSNPNQLRIIAAANKSNCAVAFPKCLHKRNDQFIWGKQSQLRYQL